MSIGPLSSPETVFGSGDAPLVVVGDSANGSQRLRDREAGQDERSQPDSLDQALAAAVPARRRSLPVGRARPVQSAPPASSGPPSQTPTPAGTVEIARGLDVVDTTAAYAPDGSAFAFTARPSDGSHGPDIYLWTVGDAAARADHDRSPLGLRLVGRRHDRRQHRRDLGRTA